MSRAEDLLNSAVGGGSYINADERKEMYVEQIPFMVTAAVPVAETQFGDQTQFQITLEGEEDEVRTLAFKYTEVRERIAKALARGIAEDGGPVGPFYLDRMPNKAGGNPTWVFVTEPVANPTSRARLRREPKVGDLPAKGESDDDIPY